MKSIIHAIIITVAAIGIITSCDRKSSLWEITENPLITEWAVQMNPEKPWDVYPRPAIKRSDWMNLNGLWDYAITLKTSAQPDLWDGKILVPYPVESALSGVKKVVTENDLIWYRRAFTIPSKWKSRILLLNFEASDWETTVWINGEKIGSHRGGYTPFSFDITRFAEAGKNCEIVVSVWDPSDKGSQPRGKQVSKPGGIWYTPTSGIWQTVWIEPVNESYIESFSVYTSVENKTITVSPTVVNGSDKRLRLSATGNGIIAVTDEKSYGEDLTVRIENALFWTPDTPTLYNLELELLSDGKTVDEITSVAGIRKVSLGKTADGITRIMLNNEYLFQNGTLDQGFWPDGLYTPPTEEAMIFDLWTLKKMGFNMLRKHVKVENRVFYNWCDRIGLIVWQDMPNGDSHISGSMPDIDKDPESDSQFRYELRQLIKTHFNHPSIIIWVPFNEGWGQYNTGGITEYVKGLDPTRLVISASGWTDRGTGDILDIHNYPEPRAPLHEENRAIVLGEYGGLGLALENHMWEQRNWGYRVMDDKSDLLERYEQYYAEVRRLDKEAGLSAVVYTQTTDVETETNGLLTYDRKVDKMGADNLRKAHLGLFPPLMGSKSSVIIDSMRFILKCPDSTAVIRYTTDNREPGSSSPVYKEPILITETTTISAKAWYPEGLSRTVRFNITREQPAEPATVNEESLKPGLKVSVYDGSFDLLPDFSTLTPVRKFTSGKVSHLIAEKDNRFALVFEGFIRIPADGVYGIAVASDDGSKLTLSEHDILLNDGIHGVTEREAWLPLKSGFHPVRIEYFQRTGGYGLFMYVESPDKKRSVIPADWLYNKPD
jgi:hypothetical protein